MGGRNRQGKEKKEKIYKKSRKLDKSSGSLSAPLPLAILMPLPTSQLPSAVSEYVCPCVSWYSYHHDKVVVSCECGKCEHT